LGEAVYLTIIIVSLLMSFYFSGTETAFVSLNKVRVELWRRQKRRIAKIVYPFIQKPEKFIYTTLIGNNIFNVAFASLATLYFNQFFDPEVGWILIVILTLIIGEILPKTIFRSLADWLIQYIAPPLRLFYIIFLPIIWVVSGIAEMLLRVAGLKNHEVQKFFSSQDIEILLNESQSLTNVNKSSGKYLKRALNFRYMRVKEVMVPLADMIAVEESITLDELFKTFQSSGHSKLPVYRKHIDQIIGVIFLKDLFQNPQDVKSLIREVMFVPETKRCSELLSIFKQNNISIAIVFDEYGGTAGMVTVTDLVNKLFGEMEVVESSPDFMIRKISKNAWIVNARIDLDELNEKLQTEFPEGDYETLAGFLLAQFGRIPRINESIEISGFKFIITNASKRRIHHVKIIKM
jgi:CBS domain containing-hemolysin-like protein